MQLATDVAATEAADASINFIAGQMVSKGQQLYDQDPLLGLALVVEGLTLAAQIGAADNLLA